MPRPKKLKPAKPGTESFLSFPVLVALSRKPMTRMELCRTLLVSRITITERLRELAALGYITQRWDLRWMLTVRLVPAEVPMPTTLPGVGVSPGLEGPAKLPSMVPQAVPGRNGKSLEAMGAHLPPDVAATAPREVPAFPTPAHRVAHFYHIPVTLQGLGTVSLGAAHRCVFGCERSTPVHYGTMNVCAICAKRYERGEIGVSDQARGSSQPDHGGVPAGDSAGDGDRDLHPHGGG